MGVDVGSQYQDHILALLFMLSVITIIIVIKTIIRDTFRIVKGNRLNSNEEDTINEWVVQ